MAQALTLARPYARAAFELAREQNALGEWAHKLAFTVQVASDAQVVALLGDPRVQGGTLLTLLLPEGESTDSSFASFVALLMGNRRLAVLPEIAALFEQLKCEAERVLKVKMRTATLIDAAGTDTLKAALKRRFNRDIELEQALDSSILGGAVIDAGEVVIDGSVRGRLARLETALTQ